MPRSIFSMPKPTYDLYGRKISRRKAFKISTKKMEWMSAAGKDPLKWRTNFVKKSKCRKCGRTLTWGDRTYDFDHKDNNPSNNSQRNCYLVCKVCHGKHTVIKKIKVRDKFTGITVGHKTIKKKIGYKKPKKKKITKKRKSKSKGTYWINPITGKKERVKSLFGF